MKRNTSKKSIGYMMVSAILLAGIAAVMIILLSTPSVNEFPLTLELMGRTFTGNYSGECKSGIPEGNGTFKAEGDIYYSYTGQWQNGLPAGSGKVETNAAILSVNGTAKQATYTGETENGKFHGPGTIVITENGKEIYRYEGTWANGQYEGKGTLRVALPDCIAYTYTGEWKNGLYHGDGSLIYDNPDQLQYIGRFEEGNYRPSFSQMIQSLCSSENSRNHISAEALTYLETHESLFRSHAASEANLISGFTCENYAETPENPDNAAFRKQIKVVQSKVYEENTFGNPVTELLGYDQKGKVFLGYLIENTDPIEKGSVVTLTAYPIGYSPIINVRGEQIPAIRFVAYAAD